MDGSTNRFASWKSGFDDNTTSEITHVLSVQATVAQLRRGRDFGSTEASVSTLPTFDPDIPMDLPPPEEEPAGEACERKAQATMAKRCGIYANDKLVVICSLQSWAKHFATQEEHDRPTASPSLTVSSCFDEAAFIEEYLQTPPLTPMINEPATYEQCDLFTLTMLEGDSSTAHSHSEELSLSGMESSRRNVQSGINQERPISDRLVIREADSTSSASMTVKHQPLREDTTAETCRSQKRVRASPVVTSIVRSFKSIRSNSRDLYRKAIKPTGDGKHSDESKQKSSNSRLPSGRYIEHDRKRMQQNGYVLPTGKRTLCLGPGQNHTTLDLFIAAANGRGQEAIGTDAIRELSATADSMVQEFPASHQAPLDDQAFGISGCVDSSGPGERAAIVPPLSSRNIRPRGESPREALAESSIDGSALLMKSPAPPAEYRGTEGGAVSPIGLLNMSSREQGLEAHDEYQHESEILVHTFVREGHVSFTAIQRGAGWATIWQSRYQPSDKAVETDRIDVDEDQIERERISDELERKRAATERWILNVYGD